MKTKTYFVVVGGKVYIAEALTPIEAVSNIVHKLDYAQIQNEASVYEAEFVLHIKINEIEGAE